MPDIDSEFNPQALEKLKHETPFFLFSKKRIARAIKEFKTTFPDSLINYAMKANSEPEILKFLSEETDIHFEAASKYELYLLKAAGVKADRIVYGTAIKPASHIKEFFDYGVDCFAFDSNSELEKIASEAPNSRVFVRVRVNDSDSVFKFSEKFGTNPSNIVSLLKHAHDLKLKPYGISFHVGSQASNPMAWANALKELHNPLKELKKAGIEIEIINLGGGFPCQYATNEIMPSLSEISKNIHKEYEKLPYKPKKMFEPGRGLVAESGILIATVIARVERESGAWLFLDAGVYNALFESMAYQGSMRYPITSMRPLYESGEALFALAGPTGDSADVITREALLPKDINVGDRLIFHNVGAYNLPTASRFNGFPKPNSYLI